MGDLLYLFGNNDEILNNPFNFENEKNHEHKVERPNKLFEPHEFAKNSTNSGTKLTNGVKYLLSPLDVHQKYISSKLRSLSCSNLLDYLPPENPNGNIEYKRQLINLSASRINHLTTQLKWRLAEGNGEAIYEIGVDDNGEILGLHKQQLAESVCNLCRMAESLNAEVIVIREAKIGKRKALELLIRKLPSYFSAHETRVAFLGSSDSGKSTLIGVLTQGELDNGQGKTRLATFRHMHEVRSGRTSSISSQLLGFDETGCVTNFCASKWLKHEKQEQKQDQQKQRLHELSHEEVVLNSARLISLIDLAGCYKYQHTTLFAITAKRPHLVILTLPANVNNELTSSSSYSSLSTFSPSSSTCLLRGVALQHCQLALALGLPLAIVITKLDLLYHKSTSSTRENSFFLINYLTLLSNQFKNWFLRHKIKLELIKNTNLAQKAALNIFTKTNIVPIFGISSVTGLGIDLLTSFMSAIDISVCDKTAEAIPEKSFNFNDLSTNGMVGVDKARMGNTDKSTEVWINEVLFEVPRVDGCVVGGLIHEGIVRNNDNLFLGPQRDGSFISIRVQSIHRNRLQQMTAQKGQHASFAIGIMNDNSDYKTMSDTVNSPSDEYFKSTKRSFDIEKGMIMLNYQPKDHLHYGAGLILDNGIKSRLAWGLVVSDINILHHDLNDVEMSGKEDLLKCDKHQISVDELFKYGLSWVIHCGNVYQKCRLIELKHKNWTDKENNSDAAHSNNDALFQFMYLPQWIHPLCPVVFHKPNKHIKAHGTVKAVLGDRFLTITNAQRNNHSENTPNFNNQKRTKKDVDFISSYSCNNFNQLQCDSDTEFVTAPSSPI